MDTQELRELTDDGDEVTADRDRAKETLNQVAGLAKQALAENGIDLDLFFLVPNSGESILMFGTSIDPDFATWARVGEIVSAIVREVVGLDDTRADQSRVVRQPTPWPVTSAPRCRYQRQSCRILEPSNEVRRNRRY
jgi:hypothetical protein